MLEVCKKRKVNADANENKVAVLEERKSRYDMMGMVRVFQISKRDP